MQYLFNDPLVTKGSINLEGLHSLFCKNQPYSYREITMISNGSLEDIGSYLLCRVKLLTF